MIWTKMRILNFLLLLICANQVFSEIIDVKPCESKGKKNCIIHKVQVTPCPEAAKKQPCKLSIDKISTIQMDFTTVPNISDLKKEVGFWHNNQFTTIPAVDANGCKYTTCPTTGEQQTYKKNITVLDFYAYGPYKIKWRLYKTNVMDCCFMTEFEVVPPQSKGDFLHHSVKKYE